MTAYGSIGTFTSVNFAMIMGSLMKVLIEVYTVVREYILSLDFIKFSIRVEL